MRACNTYAQKTPDPKLTVFKNDPFFISWTHPATPFLKTPERDHQANLALPCHLEGSR